MATTKSDESDTMELVREFSVEELDGYGAKEIKEALAADGWVFERSTPVMSSAYPRKGPQGQDWGTSYWRHRLYFRRKVDR